MYAPHTDTNIYVSYICRDNLVEPGDFGYTIHIYPKVSLHHTMKGGVSSEVGQVFKKGESGSSLYERVLDSRNYFVVKRYHLPF